MIKKVVDEGKKLTEEEIERTIFEDLGLLEDLIIVGNELVDEYRAHRMRLAVDRIREFVKKVDLTLKEKYGVNATLEQCGIKDDDILRFCDTDSHVIKTNTNLI